LDDGLSDALNAAGEGYGEQRLEQLVSGLSTEKPGIAFLSRHRRRDCICRSTSQFDDLTALAFIYHPNAVGIRGSR